MVRGMRALALIGAVVALAGCTEVYSGPRLVHYNQDWFYVRHAPLIDSSGTVDQLAAEQCPDPRRPAQRVDAAQYYPFDLRDATYHCGSPPPAGANEAPAVSTPASAS